MGIRVLSDTEEQVARLLAAGRTEADVASELGLTETAVAAHRSRVFRKLGAQSESELPGLLLRINATKEEE